MTDEDFPLGWNGSQLMSLAALVNCWKSTAGIAAAIPAEGARGSGDNQGSGQRRFNASGASRSH
jgi:hypothetical protein